MKQKVFMKLFNIIIKFLKFPIFFTHVNSVFTFVTPEVTGVTCYDDNKSNFWSY